MKAVSPRHYTLEFAPDLRAFTFEGNEQISIVVNGATAELVLDAAELKIHDCSVRWKGKTLNGKATPDEKNETLRIILPEKISGEAELLIRFSGVLNDRLVGFYRSVYAGEDGKPHTLATTQFEAADARRAFPCWDEPEAKATFDVTLTVDKGLMALSNMPVVEEKNTGVKKAVRFARTPVMSTYLLYLGVGDFEWLEKKQGKITIRVVTVKGKKNEGAFALEFTGKALRFFEEYFGILYPLPQLDMIAIPDFASGAMENWGAITFRETMLLYDQKTSSLQTLQDIGEVIAHELAHQWFGNLVTMKWWNDLWLNESFATFMATKAADHFYPEWYLWDQFLKTAMVDAMGLDALRNSHPIDVEVKKPAEIREIFDSISYDKGGCVLRMLEDFVGEENFRAGLRNYLTAHKFGNATTQDLWKALAAASKQPVVEMMNSWVKQVGYPVVDLHGSVLVQHRFLLDGHEEEGRWIIPLSVQTSKERFALLMMEKNSSMIAPTDDWVKLNVGQKGFYRVKYSDEQLAALKKAIDGRVLGNIDRWGVQHDLFALYVAGMVPLRQYLDFVEGYARDEDYLASSDVAGALYFLFVLFAGEGVGEKVVDYNRKYFRTVFDRIGWEPRNGEKSTDVLYRSFVIGALGRHGDKNIVGEARRRFDAFLKKPESLHPDIRSTVYSLVAWSGDEKAHAQLVDLYRKTKSAEEKVRFLAALSNFADEKLLQKTLRFSLSPDVRSQDLIIPITIVGYNPSGKKILWPWMRDNWKALYTKLGEGNFLLNKMLGSVAMSADPGCAAEFEAFFKKNRVPGTERKVAQTLERMKIYARMKERAGKEI